MTTLRLAAAEHSLTDHDNPTKTDFHRMLKNGGGDFLKTGFLRFIEQGIMKQTFDTLHSLLCHSERHPNGLPLHALPLLKRPLVQVLLRWTRIAERENLQLGREEMLRFSLFWLLCVNDASKASRLAFKILYESKEAAGGGFPAKLLSESLIKARLATPLASPSALLAVPGLVFARTTQAQDRPLRGWNSRFLGESETEHDKQCRVLYARWWNKGGSYVHPILLWLQRDYVSIAFADINPLAGRGDETPYDYDHICPNNHWGNWTGAAKGNTLLDFSEPGAHWQVGNSIGNVRIWGSRQNRSDGDQAPAYKLGLKIKNDGSAVPSDRSRLKESLLRWSAIPADEGHIEA